MPKRVSRGLRFDEKHVAEIAKAARDGGFASPSAFMRAAVERELKGQESNLDETELRVTASLDRVARELRGVRLGHQALFAFVDSLAKTLLTCVPEPPPDSYNQAVARGKARYDRFLKSVGMGMAGDSRAALTELVRRVQEE
jgi:Arc/MetJ-type ribon-helix-helix transcriptional regulator